MRQIIFTILLFSIFNATGQNCSNFNNGIYKLEVGFGNFTMERYNGFQLERCPDFEAIYLHKIEKISDCEYILHRYKIINLGILSTPDMNEKLRVKINRTDGNTFYFTSIIIGTETTLDGAFIKVSNDISEDFKKLLINEK